MCKTCSVAALCASEDNGALTKDLPSDSHRLIAIPEAVSITLHVMVLIGSNDPQLGYFDEM
jgi:hypothetical protein